ncbi:hypothetical protein LA080_013954 [Diaporthe eres]|nr:hypothetical protein LA080_013954 [Diaporthe eres]
MNGCTASGTGCRDGVLVGISDSSYGFNPAVWEDHLSGANYKSPYIKFEISGTADIVLAESTVRLRKGDVAKQVRESVLPTLAYHSRAYYADLDLEVGPLPDAALINKKRPVAVQPPPSFDQVTESLRLPTLCFSCCYYMQC